MDLRNHGRTYTAAGAMTMSYDSMATDVFETLQGMSATECHIVGHSMVNKIHNFLSTYSLFTITYGREEKWQLVVA